MKFQKPTATKKERNLIRQALAVMHFSHFSLLHALVVLAATLRFHYSVGAVNGGHVHLTHPRFTDIDSILTRLGNTTSPVASAWNNTARTHVLRTKLLKMTHDSVLRDLLDSFLLQWGLL